MHFADTKPWPPEDQEWMSEDIRNRRLAYDPDTGDIASARVSGSFNM
jgi:hypothetical protein